MLLDRPEFRQWFHDRYGDELPEKPEDRKMPLGDCDGCGASGAPVLEAMCLVCLAETYGQSRTEQRLADGVRDFMAVLTNGPRDDAHRLVGELLDTFFHSTQIASDRQKDQTSP